MKPIVSDIKTQVYHSPTKKYHRKLAVIYKFKKINLEPPTAATWVSYAHIAVKLDVHDNLLTVNIKYY